jgi:hypothetical protein
LGAGVSGMPFSLYRKLNSDKLVPNEVSLQMADKSTAIPIGICENVPDIVSNVKIPTDFVILDMPEDDNLSIILGRPFFNTARAIIDCPKSKVTFKVKGNEHTIYFPKKSTQEPLITEVNLVKAQILMVGNVALPIPPPPPKYKILMIGSTPIKYEVT